MWIFRTKYAKMGRIRFISHLDLKRALTRALIRADLPIAYSKGFNPRPKISMGPALPLGYESRCELADVALTKKISEREFTNMLMPAMPDGLDLLAVKQVLPTSPKLSQASSVCYVIELPQTETLDSAITRTREFLLKESMLAERMRKDAISIVDIRRFVIGAKATEKADSRWLQAEISIGGQGTCNASEVAQAVFDLPTEKAKCLRIIGTEIRFDGRPLWVNTDEENQEETIQERREDSATA